ncbi:MAG: glutaredoxin domain-containing protein [Candidatus Gracilibacteria bacterium]|nr:glutaredoxin domain-containing protein [Candidatus Gracilibacteria bacterium]
MNELFMIAMMAICLTLAIVLLIILILGIDELINKPEKAGPTPEEFFNKNNNKKIMKEIIIYTSDNCTNCFKLKGILDNKEIKYSTLDAKDHMDLLISNKVMNLPGVQVDGEFIHYEKFINDIETGK